LEECIIAGQIFRWSACRDVVRCRRNQTSIHQRRSRYNKV